jgi:hypothetical protein
VYFDKGFDKIIGLYKKDKDKDENKEEDEQEDEDEDKEEGYWL